jgi:hypothetical protein
VAVSEPSWETMESYAFSMEDLCSCSVYSPEIQGEPPLHCRRDGRGVRVAWQFARAGFHHDFLTSPFFSKRQNEVGPLIGGEFHAAAKLLGEYVNNA